MRSNALLEISFLSADNRSGSSGKYLEDCQPQKLSEFATDPVSAEKLWELTEGLVGYHLLI